MKYVLIRYKLIKTTYYYVLPSHSKTIERVKNGFAEWVNVCVFLTFLSYGYDEILKVNVRKKKKKLKFSRPDSRHDRTMVRKLRSLKNVRCYRANIRLHIITN